MDAAERALLEQAVGSALSGGDTIEASDGALAELGWLENARGRATRRDRRWCSTALGTSNRATTVLDDVVVSALGRAAGPDLAVLIPPFGSWSPPRRPRRRSPAPRVALATARVTSARSLLVVWQRRFRRSSRARAGIGHGRAPGGGRRSRCRLQHGARGALRGRCGGTGGRRVGSRPSPSLAARSRTKSWAASRAMLALRGAYTLERVQFGRPVASFQAVRHRLADALVAVEALDATLGAAGDEPSVITAALAKATAGRTARTVAAQCQQVLAGIGFTTDHPFHRSLKRTMLLEGLFGSADEIALDLGRQLLASAPGTHTHRVVRDSCDRLRSDRLLPRHRIRCRSVSLLRVLAPRVHADRRVSRSTERGQHSIGDEVERLPRQLRWAAAAERVKGERAVCADVVDSLLGREHAVRPCFGV